VAGLRSIDQNSTKQDLEDALKGVQSSWQDLRQSGQTLRQARLDVVESSFNELEKTITGIADDATLADARAEIYQTALEGVAQVLEAQKLVCSYQIEPQR
jgi:ATP phosphoribosyltransferase